MSQLSTEEIAKIPTYLNVNMLASPNHIYVVYDGDGSVFSMFGPPGSVPAENLLVTYLNSFGLKTVPTTFDGRSDYRASLKSGIPSGGV